MGYQPATVAQKQIWTSQHCLVDLHPRYHVCLWTFCTLVIGWMTFWIVACGPLLSTFDSGHDQEQISQGRLNHWGREGRRPGEASPLAPMSSRTVWMHVKEWERLRRSCIAFSFERCAYLCATGNHRVSLFEYFARKHIISVLVEAFYSGFLTFRLRSMVASGIREHAGVKTSQQNVYTSPWRVMCHKSSKELYLPVSAMRQGTSSCLWNWYHCKTKYSSWLDVSA